MRIGVAFDDAFCFYYPENLELLEDAGAEIVTFSPLEDHALPRDLGLIYIGGGISEAFVPKLAANLPFLESIRRARMHGIPVYAEGCGLQYSARSLRTSDGEIHQMAGLIPIDVALEAGTLHSGYRDLTHRDILDARSGRHAAARSRVPLQPVASGWRLPQPRVLHARLRRRAARAARAGPIR